MNGSKLYGITMGDASGVGPEILLKAFANGELRWPFVAYGDLAALEFTMSILATGSLSRHRDCHRSIRREV